MGHKKAKKSEKNGVDFNATAVKNLFVEFATPEGIVLTSSVPQMKDLGSDGYRYTMWGVNGKGRRCLVVLATDRNSISQKENWQEKYPAMRTVTGDIVAIENQKFATKKMMSLCAAEDIVVTDKVARPVEMPFPTNTHYGYAMCATQGHDNGFAVMESGADMVSFWNNTPKFL